MKGVEKRRGGGAAVAGGQGDAGMMYVGAAGWMSKQNDALTPASFTINNGEVYAYSVRLADKELRERLDRGLECLKQNGKRAAIFKKGTSLDPLPGVALVTVAAGYGRPGYPSYDEAPHALSCK